MSDLVEVTCGQLSPTFLPTTHLALMVPEIILEYLVHLFDERNYRNIRDIDKMALVCRTWRTCSLPLKWKRTNLELLVRMLGPRAEGGGRFHFITPPDLNDWNRFYKYASLVSTLYFNDAYLLHGFMNLKKVGPRSEDDLMLPNLQALELLLTTPVALGRTLNFVPSTLTTFTAKCDTILSQYQSQIFGTIAERLSMLYELSLLGVETTIKVDQAIAGLLKALSNLRRFTIEYGEVEEGHSEWILESTARAMESSSLEYLDVRREKPTWPASPLRWNNRQGGFRDLIELQIRCDMHEGTLSLLSNIGTHGHSLRRLTLIQEAVYGLSDEVSLLPLMITVRKHEELDQFRIEAHRTSSLTAATLEPLGLCVRLKSLEMNITTRAVQITETEIGELLKHLPSLKRFEFFLAQFPGKNPSLTLNTLLSCLKHCPLLERFSAWINGTVTDQQQDLAHSLSARHRNLIEVDFVRPMGARVQSPVDSIEATSALLSGVSAKQLLIQTGDVKGLWREVAHLVSKARYERQFA